VSQLRRLGADLARIEQSVDEGLGKIGHRRPSVVAAEDGATDTKRAVCMAVLTSLPDDDPTKKLYLAGKLYVEEELAGAAVFSLPPVAVPPVIADGGAGVGLGSHAPPFGPPVAMQATPSATRLTESLGGIQADARGARLELEMASTRTEVRRAVRNLRRALGKERLFESDFRCVRLPALLLFRRLSLTTPLRSPAAAGTRHAWAPRSSASASTSSRSSRWTRAR